MIGHLCISNDSYWVTIDCVNLCLEIVDMKKRELILMFACEIIIAAAGVDVDTTCAAEKGEMVRIDTKCCKIELY